MKAAVLREVGKPLQIEDVQINKPGPREVLVRTKAAGLCHSDLHFMEGSYPHPLPAVLGHESAGVVEAVGSEVRTVKPGDHVITCLSAYCGHCESCLTGRLSLCVSPETKRDSGDEPRLTQNGAPLPQFLNLSSFAEYMLIHEHACVSIRKDMPLDRAALIGCSVMTGVGAAIHTSGVRPGETVAVIGCGGVGLSAINGAAIAGAGRIIAVDMFGSKDNLAREFGATDFIDASKTDAVKEVLEMTRGGVHHAFEAIGLSKTAEQAFNMLRRGGTANIIGMIPIGQNVTLPGAAFLGEKRIQGSLMGSNRFPVDMPRLVDFYMSGKLKLDEMISQRIRLDQVNEGFADMKKGGLATDPFPEPDQGLASWRGPSSGAVQIRSSAFSGGRQTATPRGPSTTGRSTRMGSRTMAAASWSSVTPVPVRPRASADVPRWRRNARRGSPARAASDFSWASVQPALRYSTTLGSTPLSRSRARVLREVPQAGLW
jgi:S-(hydroxymethyl)glutathione dehydrogenase/alcohol dehydrogenase